MEKKFVVCFGNKHYATAEAYSDIIEQLNEGVEYISTHNVVFADLRIITEYGYRLFIYPQTGEPFEITLGDCENLDRELRPAHNLFRLLVSGAFDLNPDKCIVVEKDW